MSQAEVEGFLAGDPLCRLGCLDEEGWPYVVPVWYRSKDGGFYIIPRAGSAWARYIKREPRVFLCIDVWEGMRKVMVKGRAEVLEEPNVGGKWVAIATDMLRRYLGEHGPEYLEPALTEPRWLRFVRPDKTTTCQGVDWAVRYKHGAW